MKAVCAVLLLASAVLAVPLHDEFRNLFDCYGKADGNYPSHGACSEAYVTCDADHRTHRHCPLNTFYHSSLDKCLVDSKTPGCAAFSTAANPCFGRPNGFYPTEGNCAAFVFCAHEIATRLSCPEGEHYNPLRHRCEDPNSFHGECGNRRAPPAFDCHHRPAGKYAHAADCQAYFECDYDSSLWTFRCNHGTAFDGTHCAPIGSVDACLPARKAGVEDVCAQGDGVFADQEDCAAATMCWAGYGWDVRCGGATPYWSDFLQGCGIVKAEQCVRKNVKHIAGSISAFAVFHHDNQAA